MFPTCSRSCRGDHPFRCSQRWGPMLTSVGARPGTGQGPGLRVRACPEPRVCVMCGSAGPAPSDFPSHFLLLPNLESAAAG